MFDLQRQVPIAISVTAFIAAIPVQAQNQDVSGEITLMAYASLFQDKYIQAVIEPFQEEYPNVTVNYYTTGGSSNMLGALRSQKSDPQTDVVIFDASTSLIGNQEGLLAPLSEEDVPNIADLVDQAIVQEGYGTAVTLDNLVIVYDTETVQPAPTSLEVLWDEKYAGRIGISAIPNIQGIALTAMTSAMVGEDYTKSIDQAVERLAELAPAVQTFDPTPDGYTMVLNGSLDFATGWNARAQFYAQDSDGALGVMLPEEGSVLQINTINLVEGAKNPEAAKAFINYALSPEAQTAFTEALYYAPVNAKAEISAETEKRTVATRLDQMLPLDWSWAATVRDQWNQAWRRRVISQ